MNKQRRAALDALIGQIQDLKDQLEGIDISEIQSEEQDYRDSMPENLQYSEKASAAEEAISNMGDAIDYLNEALSNLDDAIDQLSTAKGE